MRVPSKGVKPHISSLDRGRKEVLYDRVSVFISAEDLEQNMIETHQKREPVFTSTVIFPEDK